MPLPDKDEVAGPEVGTEDEYGGREIDGEEADEDDKEDRLEDVGNTDDEPGDDGKSDE